MKRYLLLLFLSSFTFGSQAQILKKLKDKVNNAIDKKTQTTSPSNTNQGSNTENVKKKADEWCKTDTIAGMYDKVYSSSGRLTVLYDESCLGLGVDSKGYMIVLTERTGNKTEYVVIDNGKETGRYPQMKDEYLPCRGKAKRSTEPDNSKYVIVDSTKISVAGTKGQTIKTTTIDENKAMQGMELGKQTDEYKKLSPEEKKQYDEMMKNMPAIAGEYNKTMANKTFQVPGTKGMSGSYPTGVRVVVNRKEYGKFLMLYTLKVSPDERNVFAVGVDQKSGLLNFIANDKKFQLQQKGFAGSGQLVTNAAGNMAAYVEMKEKTAEEMQKDANDIYNAKYAYRVLRSDGKAYEITVTGYATAEDFRMANTGALVYVNAHSGEIFSDGKLTGKFRIDNNDPEALNAKNILMGDNPDNICFYGSDGSLNYPDGSKKNLGIFFPSVVSQGGKTYINWFRQCGNEIYIGKMSF